VKYIFSLFIFSFVALTTQSQGIIFEENISFNDAIAKAKAENKIIFMDCYTTWCGPCKRLAANVFPLADVGGYFNAKFINTKVDMEKGEGPAIAAEFGVRAYPTLLFIDGNRKVVNRVVGLVDGPTLIAGGKQANNQLPGLMDELKGRYDAGNRTPEFLQTYVDALLNDGVNYDKEFSEWLKALSDKDLQSERTTKQIFNYTNSIASPGMAYVLKNKVYYNQVVGDKVVSGKVNSLAEKAMKESLQKQDKTIFDAGVKVLQALNAADASEQINKLSMDYAARTNDWSSYDKFATAYIKKSGTKDAFVLNDVAWNYYLNVNDKALLQKASKWAFEAVNLKNTSTNNITYAYLLYKTGNIKEAIKSCDYAILRAKEERLPTTGAEELKRILETEGKK
jgi:thiol-disulfide isomerase/thioredoxin